jgi:hypothetical protein
MIRVELAVAAIALIATVAVASAQAQTQTTSPEPTIWDHNGSVMYLVANGPSREFHYQKPRAGMLEVGVRPGSLLFRGEIDKGQYSGTAYIFNPHCGQIPFQVNGPILDNDERILLTGQAPRVGRNCHVHKTYTSNLEFRRLKSNQAAQSQEPPLIEIPKPDVPSRNGDELPSGATAEPSMKNVNPVAGRDSSLGVADHKVPSTLAVQATNEVPGAKDLDKYKWEAAFVMIVWLLIVLFGKILIRKNG